MKQNVCRGFRYKSGIFVEIPFVDLSRERAFDFSAVLLRGFRSKPSNIKAHPLAETNIPRSSSINWAFLRYEFLNNLQLLAEAISKEAEEYVKDNTMSLRPFDLNPAIITTYTKIQEEKDLKDSWFDRWELSFLSVDAMKSSAIPTPSILKLLVSVEWPLLQPVLQAARQNVVQRFLDLQEDVKV